MVSAVNFGIDKVRLWLPNEAARLTTSWSSAGFTLNRGKVLPTGEVTEKPLIPDSGGIVQGEKLWLNAEYYVMEIGGHGVLLTFNPSAGKPLAGSGDEIRKRTAGIFKHIREYMAADFREAKLKQLDCTQDSFMQHTCNSYKPALNALAMKRQADNRLEFPDSMRFGKRGRLTSVIAYDRGKKLAGGSGDSTNHMRVEAQVTSRKGTDKIGSLYSINTWRQLLTADYDELQQRTREYLSTDLFKFSPAEFGQQSLPIYDIRHELDYALEHERQAMRAINLTCRWYGSDALLAAVGGIEGLADRLKAAGKKDRTVRHIIAQLRHELNQRALKRRAMQRDSFLSATYSELFEKFAA